MPAAVTNTTTNQRKLNLGGLTHVPSRRWYGGVIAVVLVLTMAIPMSYAFLDWDWQQAQGSRNWWAAGIGTMVFATMLRYWRNDPRRMFGRDEEAEV